MCNSSLEIINSTSMFNDETVIWYYAFQSHFGIVLISAMTALSFIVGMPIYCWSLWMFFRRNIKPSLVFSLNLTVLGLIFCFSCFTNLFNTNIFSVPAYQFSLFLNALCWTVRPLLQICMCFEHYVAVVHPVTFLRYNSIRYRIALITAVWLIGLSNSLRVIFFNTIIFPDHIFFSLFCIAVITASFCCNSVLYALKRRGLGEQKKVQMTEKDRHNKTDRGRAVENQQKRKAFGIIFHILVAILVCYLPLVVAYFMLIAQIDCEVYSYKVLPYVLSITMFNLLLSPIIRIYNDGHLKHKMCFSKLRELRK